MKNTVTIPKWIYVILLAGAILNVFNFAHDRWFGGMDVNIYYHGEKQ